ncbi:MAG: PTS sugar transporter subunit IIA [Magnetococcales bacterium]|nr:PTS sugar transporter subunit IIA [Magnetococcales bacterium]
MVPMPTTPDLPIRRLLTPERVIPNLDGTDKIGALSQLAGVLAIGCPGTDAARVLRILLEREELGSTGIGNGVAIPHGRLSDLQTPLAALGRSRSGIQFNSLDGQPVHLLVVLLSPPQAGPVHLRALSRISRLLRSPTTRIRLMEASNRETLYQVTLEEDPE